MFPIPANKNLISYFFLLVDNQHRVKLVIVIIIILSDLIKFARTFPQRSFQNHKWRYSPLPPYCLDWHPPCGTTKFHSKSVTPLQNKLELPSAFVNVVKLNIQELLQSSIISATSQSNFSKLHKSLH